MKTERVSKLQILSVVLRIEVYHGLIVVQSALFDTPVFRIVLVIFRRLFLFKILIHGQLNLFCLVNSLLRRLLENLLALSLIQSKFLLLQLPDNFCSGCANKHRIILQLRLELELIIVVHFAAFLILISVETFIDK